MAKKKPKTKSPDNYATFGNTGGVELSSPSISAAGSQPQRTTGGNALATRRPVRRSPAPRRSPSGAPGVNGGVAPGTPVSAADPLAPMSMADMIREATAAAAAQIQPGLNAIGQDAATAQSAHDTRGQQLQGWADYSQGNLNSAFDDTRNAINNLITLQGGVDQSSKDALAAALRAGTGTTDAAASALGVATPTDLSPILSSSADSAKSAELGVNSGAGALLGLMGAQRSLPSVGLKQNQDVENQRYNAQTLDFAKQRGDLTATVPGLVKSSLNDQKQFELAKAQFGQSKANDLFQRYLAEQELGLKKKDQSFQQWLASQQLGETKRSNKANEGLQRQQFLHQRNIDWANVGINRTQAEGTLAQIAADAAKEKNATKKEGLQKRGEAIATGLEWLSGYMATKKGESTSTNGDYPYGAAVAAPVDDPATPADESKNGEATTEYKRTFDDALRGLTNYMSRSDALRILLKSEYGDWRQRAQQYYSRMKRRPGSGASGYLKGSGKPD